MIYKPKLIRISTISAGLNILLKGQLAFLNDHYEVTAISGQDKTLEEVKIREGVNIHAINIQRRISLFKDFESLIRLYFYFKKEKPFIVHSITPKAGLLSILAAKFANVPIRMHTFTGLIFPTRKGLMQKLLIKMDRLLCWAATNVYPEGNGVRNDLIRFKITNKPLKIFANGNVNGIDISHFDPQLYVENDIKKFRHMLNFTDNDFVFIFVGRLVKDKGINELVAAFKKVNTKSLHTRLLLVGPFEKDLDPLLPETIQEIEKNPNIVSVGPQNDVRQYLAISNCLVFPSYREGFPNVPLEAGAMGLPSIVTDINGCNEIIIEGENGVIIPPKDITALYKKMKYFFDNLDETERMAANSRPLIMNRYEQSMVWEALLEEYKLLENNIKSSRTDLNSETHRFVSI